MIDVWTEYWKAHEEKYNDRAMITLYQLKTDANVRLASMATSNALSRTHNVTPRCEHFGFSIWAAFSEVRKCDEVIIFIEPYKHFVSFHVSFWASSKLILTFTKWGGVACETTSVYGPQCNVRPQNTTSVHGQQLPSTSAPSRYLIHCFQHEWAKNDTESPWGSRTFLPLVVEREVITTIALLYIVHHFQRLLCKWRSLHDRKLSTH